MVFLLKLLCNILILLFVYISGTYLWDFLYLNMFLDWARDNAWIAVGAISIAYGFVAASILFSVVETLLPS